MRSCSSAVVGKMTKNLKTIFLACFLAGALSACSIQSPNRPTTPLTAEIEAPVVEAVDVVPLDHVTTLMGTDSTFDLSYGNTYPAIATPWGMNFWTPMTAKIGDGWTYKYDDHKIRGFKQTHQPSPWLNDYAAFALMAVTGELKVSEDERPSWFSHKAETAKPHYYSVYLADYDTTVEIAPTSRAAHFQFTFPETDQAYILLDGFPGGSQVSIDAENRTISGYVRNNHGGVPENFHNYFVAQFSHDFEVKHSWTDGYTLQADAISAEGDHVGAVVGFKTTRGEKVEVKVASSFISPDQAKLNLEREIGQSSFEETKAAAESQWNEVLGRIQINDPDQAAVRTFYSTLYRVLLFPRPFHETNAKGERVHYSPYNGKIEAGPLYTDNGFWDTFRAVFPYFTLMHPEFNADLMAGLVNTYEESGWLPEWASPGHRGVMIGSNSAINIADAYLKGIEGYDIDTLYEATMKNATTTEGRPVSKHGDVITSVGREGVEYYNNLGYVPYDVGIHENAARTLEYAFADFNLMRLALALGKTDDAQVFAKRAQNFLKLFDPESGWMRGKNEDGTFQTPFNPLKWGDAFTEGNSLHYSWSVFHDIAKLIDLMGGEDAFIEKLEGVFEMPPHFDDSYYGFTIHEIREMQIVNMGNYAHGNQPVQHMLYLYNHAGAPWRGQKRIRDVLDKLYSPTPDGYPGDEDNGQTSAWFVFSALGFYPVTPGTDQYVLGSPRFAHAVMQFENGNELEVIANNNSLENVYVQSVTLNGEPHTRSWISHEELQSGGKLVFEMGPQPNTEYGAAPEDRPYSMSLDTSLTIQE